MQMWVLLMRLMAKQVSEASHEVLDMVAMIVNTDAAVRAMQALHICWNTWRSRVGLSKPACLQSACFVGAQLSCYSVRPAGSPRIGTKDYAREAPLLEALDEGIQYCFMPPHALLTAFRNCSWSDQRFTAFLLDFPLCAIRTMMLTLSPMDAVAGNINTWMPAHVIHPTCSLRLQERSRFIWQSGACSEAR